MRVSCLLTLATAIWSSQASQSRISADVQQDFGQKPIPLTSIGGSDKTAVHIRNATSVSPTLFAELEELSRVVDITYCVGSVGAGIQPPFACPSRCGDFPSFELITVRPHPLLM